MHENSDNRYIRALFAELRRLGHIEGKNLKIERYGRETTDVRSKATIAAIVDSKPDIIFVVGVGAVFMQATNRIPIVAFSFDPIREGLVKSLARPGGNITGVSFNPEVPIHGKRIALLREMFPSLRKLAFLATRGQLNDRGPRFASRLTSRASNLLAVLSTFQAATPSIATRYPRSRLTAQTPSWSL
jgi:putative ABC transport system substrate-binding protein